MYYRQGIRDFNLISQEHRKRNGNLIHCSVVGKGERGKETWAWGRKCKTELEDEREWRGDKQGKNSLPHLADLGNPAISQQPESRGRWAMSLTSLFLPPPLYLSSSLPFLPPLFLQMSWSLSFPPLLSLSPLFSVLSLQVYRPFLSFASTSLNSLCPHPFLSLDVWSCLTTAQARL